MSNKPAWLVLAAAHIGLREIPGAPTSPVIAGWLAKLGAWWRDDETPWCGTFVAAFIQGRFQLPKHWYRAKGWLDWGVELAGPAEGCIVVFERQGGGHVGFVVGRDTAGRLLVLGGNQGNAVTIAPFDTSRVVGYRWPVGAPIPAIGMSLLPTQLAQGAASRNEA